MDDKKFDTLCKKLDRLTGIVAIQGIDDIDKKIYALKKLSMKSEEIERLLGVPNVRKRKGWKKK